MKGFEVGSVTVSSIVSTYGSMSSGCMMGQDRGRKGGF